MEQDLLLALVWYATLTCFGVVALPVSMRVFRNLPDGGLLLSRPLGWLLISWAAWILACLGALPFSLVGIGIAGTLLLVLSIYTMSRRAAWIRRKIRAHWRTALNGEIVTILVYLLILLARREDPSINNTEKPMDIMLLNALAVGTEIPPGDPWFAGHAVNYHYGGYLLNAVPAKLLALPPEIAYNLAIGGIAAMAASIVFVLGRALFGRCRWGAASVAFTLLLGNLAGFFNLFKYDGLLKDVHTWRFGYMWSTSRVIFDLMPSGRNEETINEYPLFTLLWGDLHPHYTNLPFMLLFAALACGVYRAMLTAPRRGVFHKHWPLLLVTMISASFLLPVNLFDFPVGSLLLGALAAGVVLRLLGRGRSTWTGLFLRLQVVLLPLIAYLLAAPFWLHFESPLKGPLVVWSQYHTGLGEFLLVFGLHAAATAAYLAMRWGSWAAEAGVETAGMAAAALGILFIALWGASGHAVYALAPVFALALWMLFLYVLTTDAPAGDNAERRRAEAFALALCAIGWSLIAGCEFIHLNDKYSSARLNTLFKFHFPAWIYFGIGLPYLVYRAGTLTKTAAARWLWTAPALVALVMSLAPPAFIFSSLFAMPAGDRPVSLDGAEFLRKERPHHYKIIQWVRTNAAADERILEIPGCGYQLESLVSAFTGRPAVVGWVGHEGLWRDNPPELWERKEDALNLFAAADWTEAAAVLKKYDVKYVAFIQPECRENLDQLGAMMNAAFRQHLDPIIVERGNRFNPNAPYELYRVPPDL